MLSKERAYAIIDLVLEEAKGYETAVIVLGGNEALTRFANSEIHQNVQAASMEVTIAVTRGHKRSAVTTGLCTAEGLRRAAGEAMANLAFLPEGEEQPPLVGAPPEIESVSLDAGLERQFTAENRARLVARTLATLEEGYKAFGALAYNVNLLAMGNSRGIRRLAIQNSVNYTALVASAGGGTGYAEARSNRAGDLDIAGAFARAYEKARLNRDPAELEPGSYTVILEPLAVGNILAFLSFMGFSGKSIQDRAGFLTGKMGERVFSEKISITDDHTDPNTFTLPFDFEGSPRRKVTIIDKGVARELTYDLNTALKDGVETTGHALGISPMGGMPPPVPLHLVMSGGDRSLEEIIAGTGDGLLVTRFNYMNPVNPRAAQLTALTRDGLFRIKDGKIAGAVKNMRFTESMLHALNNVEAVSRERQKTGFFNFGCYYVPALKINNFHFTGKSS